MRIISVVGKFVKIQNPTGTGFKKYLAQDLDVTVSDDQTVIIKSYRDGELSFKEQITNIDCPGATDLEKIEWLGEVLTTVGKEGYVPTLGKQAEADSQSVTLAANHPAIETADAAATQAIGEVATKQDETNSALTQIAIKQEEQKAELAAIKTALQGELETSTDTVVATAVAATTAAIVAGDTVIAGKVDDTTAAVEVVNETLGTQTATLTQISDRANLQIAALDAIKSNQDEQTAGLDSIDEKLGGVLNVQQAGSSFDVTYKSNSATYTQVELPADVPTEILADDANRRDWEIFNNSETETIWVALGTNVETGNAGTPLGRRILPLETYKPNLSVYTGTITAKVVGGSAWVTVTHLG
jgi:hypothetical protein